VQWKDKVMNTTKHYVAYILLSSTIISTTSSAQNDYPTQHHNYANHISDYRYYKPTIKSHHHPHPVHNSNAFIRSLPRDRSHYKHRQHHKDLNNRYNKRSYYYKNINSSLNNSRRYVHRRRSTHQQPITIYLNF